MGQTISEKLKKIVEEREARNRKEVNNQENIGMEKKTNIISNETDDGMFNNINKIISLTESKEIRTNTLLKIIGLESMKKKRVLWVKLIFGIVIYKEIIIILFLSSIFFWFILGCSHLIVIFFILLRMAISSSSLITKFGNYSGNEFILDKSFLFSVSFTKGN